MQGSCNVALRNEQKPSLRSSSAADSSRLTTLPLGFVSRRSAGLQCQAITACTLLECEHTNSLSSRLWPEGTPEQLPSLTTLIKVCAHVQGRHRRSCPWPQELPGCLRGRPALPTLLVGTHQEQNPPGTLLRQRLGPARDLLRLPPLLEQGPEAVKGQRWLDALAESSARGPPRAGRVLCGRSLEPSRLLLEQAVADNLKCC